MFGLALLPQVTLVLAPAFLAAADPAGADDTGRAPFAVVEVPAAAGDSVRCPTARQVRDALTTRVPGIVAAGAPAPDARTLRLGLTQVSANTVRVILTDTADAVVLERALELGSRQPSQPDRAAVECAALADTVALIVERYLREVGYRPPPKLRPPPPASSPPGSGVAASPSLADRTRFLLGVGSNLATPITGRDGNRQWSLSVEVAAELHLRWVAFSLSAGVGEATRTPAVAQTDGGTLRLTPMPLRLGAALPLGAGPGYLLPRIGAGVDVLWIGTSRIGGDHPGTQFEPVVEAGAAYLLPLGRRFYLRVQALSVLNLLPHDFALGPDPAPLIFRTARAYVRAGLELGVVFPN